jgi:hypothetical protein
MREEEALPWFEIRPLSDIEGGGYLVAREKP